MQLQEVTVGGLRPGDEVVLTFRPEGTPLVTATVHEVDEIEEGLYVITWEAPPGKQRRRDTSLADEWWARVPD